MTKTILPKILIALLLTDSRNPGNRAMRQGGRGGTKTSRRARGPLSKRSPLSKESKAGILAKADRAVAAGIPAEDVSIIITRGLSTGRRGPTYRRLPRNRNQGKRARTCR